MKSKGNFYIDSNEGNPNGIAFHGVICLYSLLEAKISECVKPFHLTPIKFNTLMIIKHKNNGEGLTQNDISHHLISSPSNTTRMLDGLHKEGLLERHEVEGDRRANLIKITQKGSDLLDKVWVNYCALVKDTAGLLEEEEVKKLGELVSKWFSKIDES